MVRREIAILVLLSIAAVPTYLFTRAVAERNRRDEARIAGDWYRRGQQQLRGGDTEGATESLRRASVRDRDNPRIALALAQVLAATNRDAEARTALLRLREASPDDPEIHLELGRLSARGGNLPDAILHYHQALYGASTADGSTGQRRRIRMELVRLLLDRGEKGRAVSEMILLAADAPPNAESHIEVAELFLEAGDAARALEQFHRAAQLDRQSAAALAGAGQSSFLLGDYASARRDLERAVEQDPALPKAAALLETTRLIQSRNPLAPRLPFAERMKRLHAGLDQAASRLDSCAGLLHAHPAPRPDIEALRAEVASMRTALEVKGGPRDPDLVPNGADLVFRIEELTSRACGEPTGLDLALLLIGRKHGATGS